MLDPIYHDFRKVLWLIWNRISLPDPTPSQYEMAEFLQFGGQKIFVTAARGWGKSWVTSAFGVWLHAMSYAWAGDGCDCKYCVRMPDVNGVGVRAGDLRIRCVSASKDRVDEFVSFSKQIIEQIEEFQFLMPQPGEKITWAFDRFTIGGAPISQSPSTMASSIFGQLTGGRANVVIFDDVETPNTSETVGMRQKLRKRMEEFSALTIPEFTRTVGLGTPQCEETVLVELGAKGYKIRYWPAEYLPDDRRHALGDRLCPSHRNPTPEMIGRTTEPQRFSDLILEEKKLEMGRSTYALQMLLDTRLSDQDKYPLRLSDLIVADINGGEAPDKVTWCNDPERRRADLDPVGFTGDFFYNPMRISDDWGPFTGSAMFIDPSGKGKDETGYAVVKERHGMLYATAVGGLQGGYSPQTLRDLAVVAKLNGVQTVIVESNLGIGMFSQLFFPALKEVYETPTIGGYVGPVPLIEDQRAVGQKELRMVATLEPVMNQHRLVITSDVWKMDAKGIPGVAREDQQAYRLGYQLTRLTRDRGCLRHDDRIDALAGAVAYWEKAMSTVSDEALNRQKQRDLKDDWKLYKKELEGLGRPHWVIDPVAPKKAFKQAPRKNPFLRR